MCGIAGYCGDFDGETLARMNRVQAHRGPDDQGMLRLADERLGLAHRRLAILDLSPTGHQPMQDATGRATIVYNGEIYNYRELRRDLERDGFSFRGTSDTEVLLNLYVRDGERMLERLNGIFAIALWDHRERALLLARDGLGVKPLYYAELPQGVVFASEIKALLQVPEVPTDLDPLAIHHHLTFLWCPAPRTLLRAVRKLPPGHAMRIQDGRVVRSWVHYDLPYDGSLHRTTEEEAAQEVAAAVRRAVERQMVADVPVGAFLSGGLDSSAVVAFASRATGGRRLECFTIGFHDDRYRREGAEDDLPYARRVAADLGVHLNEVHVGPEIASHLETMLYHLDEPQADPAPIHVLLISRLAREHGIKVLLSGAGGDDIFAGYRRHHALLRESLWSWVPRPGRRLLAAAARRLPVRSVSGRRIRRALHLADEDGDRRIASYFGWIEPALGAGLYGPAIKGALADRSALDPLLTTLESVSPQVGPLDRMLVLEAKHFLADHNLNYTDKMGMAEGVEIRVPLLDVDLVALAASLPAGFKWRGREGKWIFKKAMEPYLPRDVIYRAKTGFGAPLRSWLRDDLRPLVDDVLSDRSLARRSLFDAASVRSLRELDAAGRVDGTYPLFAILCIELWCRIFLDSSRSVPVAAGG